ncbi:MAG: DGQHR domain-containing protein, partial [Deltaproteobacteria bacterium]
VDGQHRIAGLLLAAERDRRFLDFEVPVNLAVSLNLVSQMCHFLIVNTTQRSVDRSVGQQIVARLTRLVELERLPTIPRWIRRQVDRGEDARALQMVAYLNSESISHWCGRIRMANDDRRDRNMTIHQKSFVESIKKYILASAHPLAALGIDAYKQQRALCNYWNAVADLLIDPEAELDSVVMKSNGVNFFHLVSQTAFHQAASRKDYTQHAFRVILERAFRALPMEDFRLGTAEFWLSGSEAGGLNQAALRRLASTLNRAMNAAPASREARL